MKIGNTSGFFDIEVIDTNTGKVRLDLKNVQNKITPYFLPMMSVHSTTNKFRTKFKHDFFGTDSIDESLLGLAGKYDDASIVEFEYSDLVCFFNSDETMVREDKPWYHIPVTSARISNIDVDKEYYKKWSNKSSDSLQGSYSAFDYPRDGKEYKAVGRTLRFTFPLGMKGTFKNICIGYKYGFYIEHNKKYLGEKTYNINGVDFNTLRNAMDREPMEVLSRRMDYWNLNDLLVFIVSRARLVLDGEEIDFEIFETDQINVKYHVVDFIKTTPIEKEFTYNGQQHKLIFKYDFDSYAVHHQLTDKDGEPTVKTYNLLHKKKSQRVDSEGNYLPILDFEYSLDRNYDRFRIRRDSIANYPFKVSILFEPELAINATEDLTFKFSISWDNYTGNVNDIP